MVPTAPDAASAVIYREPPRYPQAARLQGVPGNVTIAAVIDVEGRVRDPKVIQSSDRIFERPAVVAMNRWRFRPARANGLPVRSKIVQEFSFSMRDSGAPGLLWVRKEPEKLKHLPPSLQWDTAPEYERIQAAVYPYEALAMKKEGVVRLAFIVGPQGRVVESKVTSTSDPVFAGAALAMVETYRFIPAGKAGQPSSALLSLEVKFSLHGNALVPNEEDTREIIRRLEHDRSSFVRPQDLDTKLSARTPPNAAFPLGVKATNGEAVIEFVVDREGIVQAPRVVSATEPAFGYAAAQAVANMRFDAPLKDGKAVDVIIRQPLKFRRAD